MLEMFNDSNEMLMAAVQELTVELQSAKNDIEKLKAGGGGGSDVPSPSVEDAGKVIVVGEDGKYELGEGGTGGGVLTVHLDDGTGTFDKTYKEIVDALESNKYVQVINGAFEEGYTSAWYTVYYISSIDSLTVTLTNGDSFTADTPEDYPHSGGGD